MKTFLLAGTLCLGLVTGAAAETWRMSVENPDGNYHTENAKLFAEDVARASKGSLEIRVHPNAELLKRPDLKRGVQQGVVQIGDITMAVLGNEDTIFEVDSIPLLAVTLEDAKKLWDASRPAIEKRLDRQGLVLLYAVPWPPQGLYAKRPVESADDIKGTRFRTYNALTSRLATLLGANPVTITPGEIPQAFSTGVIDVMLTSAATGVDFQAWDFVKHYYDVKAFSPKQFAIMNKAAFGKLPEPTRKAVLEAGQRAETRGWTLARERTEDFTKKLAANGMSVQPTPPKLAQSFKGIAETMLKEWLEKAGPDGQAIVAAYRK
jgi:TRAP-type C4-dicarboxylate transport system substrate-binding protein